MNKSTLKKIFDFASIVSAVVSTVALVLFFAAVLIEAFAKLPCNNLSNCYAIVIFLVGVIVALKIRLLDEGNRWVELILFILGTLFNVLFIVVAFFLDCSFKENDAIKVLNGAIWMDFVVVMKSLGLVVALYFKKYINKNSTEKKIKIKKQKNDIFKIWLNKKEESVFVKRALIDKSYTNVSPTLKNEETNVAFIGFGESIYSMCMSNILLDKVDKPNVTLLEFKTDAYFIKIAMRYDIISHIKKDPNKKMANDYNYSVKKGFNRHKYIANAVKAMIAAIYLETKDLEALKGLIESWMKL